VTEIGDEVKPRPRKMVKVLESSVLSYRGVIVGKLRRVNLSWSRETPEPEGKIGPKYARKLLN
jgi:hypothetical protein